MVFEGTLQEVLEPWYLLYGRHMGRSRQGSGGQLFPEWVCRPSLERSWGAFLQIWQDFRCPLGSLGAPFSLKNGVWFEV